MKEAFHLGAAAALIFASSVLAQDKKPEPAPDSEATRCCPGCMMMHPRGMRGMGMRRMRMQGMGTEKGRGMNPEMMQRCRAMMEAGIYLDGPAALLARAEELGLTDEQKRKLEQIQKDARRQARAVLTAAQRGKLGETPDAPVSMVGMHRRMMRGMRMGPARMMMCPMKSGPAPEKAQEGAEKTGR